MVKTLLVSQIIEDGVRFLHELDRRSFQVEAMFWIDVPEHHYFRLVIASPVVRTQGSTATYRKLGDMIRAIGVSGFDLADVSVFEPESQQFLDYRAVIETSSRIDIGDQWVVFEDGIVYRWTGASVAAELSCEVTREQLSRIWEAESRRSNRPRVLFSVEGQRVTMRFHPQHGPQRSIEGSSQPFLSHYTTSMHSQAAR